MEFRTVPVQDEIIKHSDSWSVYNCMNLCEVSVIDGLIMIRRFPGMKETEATNNYGDKISLYKRSGMSMGLDFVYKILI